MSDSETNPLPEQTIYEQDFVDRIEVATQKIRDVVKGNVFHPIEDVELISYEEVDVEFKAQTRFILQSEGGEKAVSRPAPGLKKIKNETELRERREKDIGQITEEPATLTALKEVILEREDKGYFWNNQRTPLALDPLEYLREEPCQTCRGLKYMECVDCHGRGHIKCRDCHGKTGGNCRLCNGQGEEQCVKCQTKGKKECHKCRAQGIIHYITSIQLSADSAFTFDKEAVPDVALPVIERLKEKLITVGHGLIIKISDDIKRKKKDHADAIMTLTYDINFPLGDAVFRVGEEEVPALVFGYKAALLDVPPFLERYMLGSLNMLREAAIGQGDIPTKIRTAAFQTRLSNEVVLGTARYGAAKTAQKLKHDYSIALEPEFIDNLVKAGRGALDRLTIRPQMTGLFFGLIPAFFISLLYVFVFDAGGAGTAQPIRLVMDLVVLGIAAFIPYLGAQLIARQSMIYALGEGIKNQLKLPKLGRQGLIGPGVVVVIFLLCSELAWRESSETAPQLYSLFRSLIG